MSKLEPHILAAIEVWHSATFDSEMKKEARTITIDIVDVPRIHAAMQKYRTDRIFDGIIANHKRLADVFQETADILKSWELAD